MNKNDLTKFFAFRTKNMSNNAIREIFRVIQQPKVISLAGGLPDPNTFPTVKLLNQLTAKAYQQFGDKMLQYDETPGFKPLQNELIAYLKQLQVKVMKSDEITIGTGSSGLLDSIGKVLLNPGDKVAVESPTFLGALATFNQYQANYIEIATDESGLIPEALEKTLKKDKIKFIYLIPTFQNPTGRTISLDRRKQIAKIARKNKLIVVEDDPYSLLRYEGKSLPPIQSFLPQQVIYVTTLSKVLAPGFRIGICIAPKLIRQMLIKAKQATDLHTSNYCQALATIYIKESYLYKQLDKSIELYRKKRDRMLDALTTNFPKNFTWLKPKGGLYIWVKGPTDLDMGKILNKCIEHNVAFIPGEPFFASKGIGKNTMRLNFSYPNIKQIQKAIKTIGEVLHNEFRKNVIYSHPNYIR